MDVLALKTAVEQYLPWPEGPYLVAASILPRREIDDAEQRAKALFRGMGCEPDGPLYELVRRCEVLAKALGTTAFDLASLATAKGIAKLFLRWCEIQEEFNATQGLEEKLKRLVIKDNDFAMDGKTAYLASSVADYYGVTISKLTDGQISYYNALRSAFEEYYIEHPDRNVSREWLNRND